MGNLKKPQRSWTTREVEFLKNNYEEMDWEELESEMRRPKSAIRAYAQKMGLKRKWRSNSWKPEEDQYLRNHIHCKLGKLANRLIDRSRCAISNRRMYLRDQMRGGL